MNGSTAGTLNVGTTPSAAGLFTRVAGGEFAIDRIVRLGAVALQFGLLMLILRTFNVESKALLYLMVLAFGGFLVHHFLPLALRLPFFALLSVAGIGVVLGPINAAWIVGLGALLIGLAHLPVPFGVRVGLILAVGAMLAAFRANWIPAPIPPVVWPILGAMFMFRLIVYLYDLRHRTAPFSVWRSAAYFFMLPNVCFPLFPVVDYRTFCRSHYNADALGIYQTGVSWMFRGVVQLLVYRLIYQQLLIDPATIVDAASAAQYMVATYLLYLKVSGSFHLIVGLMHLFGFNLSETNHRYLLSSSFTDFWRRINIYWKDFILKIFFNPMYLRLSKRKWGIGALVAATLYAFFATWALHSYQTFWIRGSFPILFSDVAFWGFLGVAVLGTALYETKFSVARRKAMAQRGFQRDLRHALCTVVMFITLCVLWTLWNCDSWTSFTSIVSKLTVLTPASAMGLGGGLLLLAGAAMVFGRSTRAHTDAASTSAKSSAAPFWRPAVRVAALSGAILAVGQRPLLLDFQPALVGIVTDLQKSKLNLRDAKALERGYYENLTDTSRFGGELGELYAKKPADWNEDSGVVQTGGWPPYVMTASTKVHYKGVTQTTNRWGMRDRDYEKEKPAGTFRIAVMGSSHTKGSGVEDDQTYENLVEDRLNREHVAGERRIELLNFSTGGYGPLCKLAQLRSEVLAFGPDVILYEGIDDETWIVNEIANAADKGHVIPFAHVNQAASAAQVEKGLTHLVAEQRLKPYAPDLLDWVFKQFVDLCRENRAEPWTMFLPRPEYRDGEQQVIQGLMQRATWAGFTVLDMSGAYDGVKNLETLWIAPWDSHPNARGHELLAEKLYANLRTRLPEAIERNEGSKTEHGRD